MNVAVPSAQHSERFGQPASSHTVTRSRARIVRFSSSTSGPWCTFGRSHSGLRVAIDETLGDAGGRQPAAAQPRPARPGRRHAENALRSRRPVAPRDVGPVAAATPPSLHREASDDVGDVVHR